MKIFKKSFSVITSFLFKKYLYADLVITEKCNMKCQMCDYWQKKAHDNFNFADAQVVAEKLKSLGVRFISITGGEPFLNRDLMAIIKLFSKDFFVVLNTNGTVLNEPHVKILKECGISMVSVSLDSLTENHDQQRGIPGTRDKAIKTIRLLKKSNVPVCIKAVLTKINENEIESLVSFARKEKIRIGFNFFTKSMTDADTHLELTDPFATIKKLLLLKRKHPRTILSSYYYLEKAKKYYKNQLQTCQAGLFYFCIFPNGNITPCAKLENNILGNILQDPLPLLKEKFQDFKPLPCNQCWVTCRGEIDPWKTDLISKLASFLRYQ